MRILVISQGYPPLDGGVATSTQRIAKNLARLGCEVTVFTFDYNRLATAPTRVLEEQDGRVLVKRIGPFYRHHDGDDNDMADSRRNIFDEMVPSIQKFNPECVLSLYAANPSLLGTYVANLLRIPHIVGVRGNDVGRNIFSTKWLPTLQFILHSSSRIVCVNGHLRNRLLMAFPQLADRTSIIKNGIEVPEIADNPTVRCKLNQKVSWQPNDIISVFIGTPRSKKGIGFLLRAVRDVQKSRNLKLLVIGPALKASERSKYGKDWDQLISDGVMYVTGQLPRTEALILARAADIVVMPSIDDGLANGLLEGMALGLCPIVSDIFNDVVCDLSAGWVVPRGNWKCLAAALIEAIDNPTRRITCGIRAKEHILLAHSAAAEAKDYLMLFEGVVSKGQSIPQDNSLDRSVVIAS